MSTVFRPYSSSDSLQSDRSSGDRQRHREKVREAVRENIADVVSEQAIIGRDGDTIVKVPIRGVKEYRFIYGDNAPGVGQGEGETAVGDVVGKGRRPGKPGPGQAGDQPGEDIYETEVSLDEIIDLMFEDLDLPDMERKTLRQTIAQRVTKRRGYQKAGVRVHLDKKRTVKNRLKRKLTQDRARLNADEETDAPLRIPDPGHRVRYRRGDITYRRREPDIAHDSNAVVLCLMDTSGSMDTYKKYIARSFFFLLYQFVRTRYDTVDLVFLAHDTRAREVSEEEFFSRGESGGTMISSAYRKALEIIDDRYHPDLWNVYCFHCSDGDNFLHDNEKAVALAVELCRQCNLFGFGEIKPGGGHAWEESILGRLEEISADNFVTVRMEGKEEVWPSLRRLLEKDPAPKETAAS